MQDQIEFVFAGDTASEIALPDPRLGLYQDVGALWHVPVGTAIWVELRGHSMTELRGRLELARAPDIPFDGRAALELCIGPIEFSSRQIVSWRLE